MPGAYFICDPQDLHATDSNAVVPSSPVGAGGVGGAGGAGAAGGAGGAAAVGWPGTAGGGIGGAAGGGTGGGALALPAKYGCSGDEPQLLPWKDGS
ncbi:MAG TPA: hypothetical protein VG708_00245 [Mycobacteriales bacterium]|nr:hypothetical protein [Mycobacteriales bacterium]